MHCNRRADHDLGDHEQATKTFHVDSVTNIEFSQKRCRSFEPERGVGPGDIFPREEMSGCDNRYRNSVVPDINVGTNPDCRVHCTRSRTDLLASRTNREIRSGGNPCQRMTGPWIPVPGMDGTRPRTPRFGVLRALEAPYYTEIGGSWVRSAIHGMETARPG